MIFSATQWLCLFEALVASLLFDELWIPSYHMVGKSVRIHASSPLGDMLEVCS